MRKFFASNIIITFVGIIGIFLLFESFSLTYATEKNLTAALPHSYEPVTRMIAEKFAGSSTETELFTHRIRQSLSPEAYSSLATVALHQLFLQKNIEQALVITSDDLKKELQKWVPEIIAHMPLCDANDARSTSFRFCKPKVRFTAHDIIESQIPPRLEFYPAKSLPPPFRDFLHYIIVAHKNLLLIIVASTLMMILFVGFIIYSPMTVVLKWISYSFFSLGIFLVFTVIALTRFSLVLPDIQGLTMGMRDFIDFLMSQPRLYLTQWTVGTFVIASGIFLLSYL